MWCDVWGVSKSRSRTMSVWCVFFLKHMDQDTDHDNASDYLRPKFDSCVSQKELNILFNHHLCSPFIHFYTVPYFPTLRKCRKLKEKKNLSSLHSVKVAFSHTNKSTLQGIVSCICAMRNDFLQSRVRNGTEVDTAGCCAECIPVRVGPHH